MESALTAIATNNPMIRITTCDRRLYQLDTRSIEVSYQFSMFSRAFATSLPAASIKVVKASLACGLAAKMGLAPIAVRSGSNGLAGLVGGGGGGGGVASVTSKLAGGGVAPAAPDSPAVPGKTRSIKARAKVRAGIYEGNCVRHT